MEELKKVLTILALSTGLVLTPTLTGNTESASAVMTCGPERWGAQYHFRDVRYMFIDGKEMRYREDYRWYCHPKGYWYKAIYYQAAYWAPAVRA